MAFFRKTGKSEEESTAVTQDLLDLRNAINKAKLPMVTSPWRLESWNVWRRWTHLCPSTQSG